jgi:hypothetical protein
MNTYVPLPNLGKTDFTFDPVTVSTFDQSMVRVDHNFTERDQLFGYWFWQRSPSTDTLAAPGATLPGFADYGHRDPQHWALDWNHTFSGNMLNEVRFAYNRVNALIRYPVKPTLPASFGFTGINPQSSEAAGLPVIPVIGYFTLGASVVPLTKLEQTYQVTDNFAWIKGHHSLKFGFAWHFAKDNSYTPAYDSGNSASVEVEHIRPATLERISSSEFLTSTCSSVVFSTLSEPRSTILSRRICSKSGRA